VYHESGTPEAIQVGELLVPLPGPTVVLVAVEVSAVKAADTLDCASGVSWVLGHRIGLALERLRRRSRP
jgi:hypothetical protein